MENPADLVLDAGRKLNRAAVRRLHPRRRTPPGSAPGTLVPDPHASPSRLHWIGYGPDGWEEREVDSPSDLGPLLERFPVSWVNVTGIGDTVAIRALGERFGIHALLLEDIVHTYQRPKAERDGEDLFVVCRMLYWHEGAVVSEQMALYVTERLLLTFQERPGDVLDPVRQRIRQGGMALRKAGPDYLAYAVLDAVIDAYFPVLEGAADRLETLEEEIFSCPSPRTIQRIHTIKRDLLGLRRAAWPLREAIGLLLRGETPRVSPETQVYLRDCYDHTVQVIDFVEAYRELAADLVDVYLTTTSNRTNEIMRVLTVIATIFIPLTFLAGLWGMNFSIEASPLNMPELYWRYGYPAALAVMAIVAGLMLLWFQRRGWLRATRNATKPGEDRRRRAEATRDSGVGAEASIPGASSPEARSGGPQARSGDPEA